ncbi:MAG: DNA adenine methylase [Armatimonadetes bacterium]|nr:DNA adenine methylase [Armatimonadota bacterium]
MGKIHSPQSRLFTEEVPKLPSTRYLGSKRKIAHWIWQQIQHLEFECFLNAMSGTAVVGYLAKRFGKRVFCNDILAFNYQVALALVENDSETLTPAEIELLLTPHPDIDYPTFIQDTFEGIYYLQEENRWLDMVVTNINVLLENPYKRALAFAALGQACLVKRPFNLFHRKNLYIRLKDVKRSFGNKTTWDTPFPAHFRNFVGEYNSLVFSNGRYNRAFNKDVFELELDEPVDLVYLDPPYLPVRGDKPDYHFFYHFLEGLVDYEHWSERIDYSHRIRPICYTPSPWTDPDRIRSAFERLFEKFHKVKYIVLSYNSMGIPSEEELLSMLRRYKQHVELKKKPHQYVLSRDRPDELLFVAY